MSAALRAAAQKTSLVFLWVARISCWLSLLLKEGKEKKKKGSSFKVAPFLELLVMTVILMLLLPLGLPSLP